MSRKGGGKKSRSRKKKVDKKDNEMNNVVSKGDFVLIEYVGRVKDTGEVFDTNIKEEAEKAGLNLQESRYRPMLVIVGEKWVVEGLDEALVGRKEGEEFEIEIPPEKGFGRRDSKKIVTTTIKKLRRAGYEGDITTGTIINVNGAPAIVRAVVSGRVMLDFNPPLAGKTLIFKVKILKKLTKEDDKIKSLIERHVPNIVDNLKISRSDGVITIDFGELALNDPRIQMEKKEIGEELLKYLGNINKVVFEDVIERSSQQAEPSQEKDQVQSGSQASA